MSRVGRAPVSFDGTVLITVSAENTVIVKGAKNSLEVSMKPLVRASVEDGKVLLTRVNDSKEARSLHGLYRALISNAVKGVSIGFSKTLELHGVGYRASVSGSNLELSLGFSHPVVFPIPLGIEVRVDKQTLITITGSSRELVGQVSAKIRDFRPPEPYLAKGVRYSGEQIRRKAGKSAGK